MCTPTDMDRKIQKEKRRGYLSWALTDEEEFTRCPGGKGQKGQPSYLAHSVSNRMMQNTITTTPQPLREPLPLRASVSSPATWGESSPAGKLARILYVKGLAAPGTWFHH